MISDIPFLAKCWPGQSLQHHAVYDHLTAIKAIENASISLAPGRRKSSLRDLSDES